MQHSISSLLLALFFLISSVTRATSTAARAFGIANQSQARPGCPCTRWGFSDFDFLSVDSDVAILNSLIVTLICIDYSIEKLASVKYIAFGMRARYEKRWDGPRMPRSERVTRRIALN